MRTTTKTITTDSEGNITEVTTEESNTILIIFGVVIAVCCLVLLAKITFWHYMFFG